MARDQGQLCIPRPPVQPGEFLHRAGHWGQKEVLVLVWKGYREVGGYLNSGSP